MTIIALKTTMKLMKTMTLMMIPIHVRTMVLVMTITHLIIVLMMNLIHVKTMVHVMIIMRMECM